VKATAGAGSMITAIGGGLPSPPEPLRLLVQTTNSGWRDGPVRRMVSLIGSSAYSIRSRAFSFQICVAVCFGFYSR
jgi:hypothetical protein